MMLMRVEIYSDNVLTSGKDFSVKNRSYMTIAAYYLYITRLMSKCKCHVLQNLFTHSTEITVSGKERIHYGI